MTWIYQITPTMIKAEQICNQNGIFMEVVNDPGLYDRIFIDYRNDVTKEQKRSPIQYTSKKEAEMQMYKYYIMIAKRINENYF